MGKTRADDTVRFLDACKTEEAFLQLMQDEPMLVMEEVWKLRTDYILSNAVLFEKNPAKADAFDPFQFPAPFLEFSAKEIIRLLTDEMKYAKELQSKSVDESKKKSQSLFGEASTSQGTALPEVMELYALYEESINAKIAKLTQLSANKYPYRETLQTIFAYTRLMEEISVFKLVKAFLEKNKASKNRHIILLEKAFNDYLANPNDPLSLSRKSANLIELSDNVKDSMSGVAPDLITIVGMVSGKGYTRFTEKLLFGSKTSYVDTKLNSVDLMIFVPQFNELTIRPFIKFRPATIYPMGLIKPAECYIYADTLKLSNARFAAHDVFHAFFQTEQTQHLATGNIERALANYECGLKIQEAIKAYAFPQLSADEFNSLKNSDAVNSSVKRKLLTCGMTIDEALKLAKKQETNVDAMNHALKEKGEKLVETGLFYAVHEIYHSYHNLIFYSDYHMDSITSSDNREIADDLFGQTEFKEIPHEYRFKLLKNIIENVPKEEETVDVISERLALLRDEIVFEMYAIKRLTETIEAQFEGYGVSIYYDLAVKFKYEFASFMKDSFSMLNNLKAGQNIQDEFDNLMERHMSKDVLLRLDGLKYFTKLQRLVEYFNSDLTKYWKKSKSDAISFSESDKDIERQFAMSKYKLIYEVVSIEENAMKILNANHALPEGNENKVEMSSYLAIVSLLIENIRSFLNAIDSRNVVDVKGAFSQVDSFIGVAIYEANKEGEDKKEFIPFKEYFETLASKTSFFRSCYDDFLHSLDKYNKKVPVDETVKHPSPQVEAAPKLSFPLSPTLFHAFIGKSQPSPVPAPTAAPSQSKGSSS